MRAGIGTGLSLGTAATDTSVILLLFENVVRTSSLVARKLLKVV